MTPANKRVLSGMRPTGKLHLGNYMGALYNWLRLQFEYDCYFFIADFHALTTDYEDTSRLTENTLEVALDWLAAGLDPERTTLFIQSWVPQHAELHLLFSMITPLGWLERVPTYKDQLLQLGNTEAGGKDLSTYGFLGYPLLQAADILVYQADYVPVGEDQVPHVELTREVARRFNHMYAKMPVARALTDSALRMFSIPVMPAITGEWKGFPEPDVLKTPSPKLPGTDGRKMSKSYGNTIQLADPEPEIRAKLKTMVTDPARVRRTDPGNPDVCPVFDLHKVFSSTETQQKVRQGCTTAGIGCIECKGWLADAVVSELKPIQERRAAFAANPDMVWEILRAGSDRAATRAEQTMREVRTAMHLPQR
jgi:tryptophanyl-tRNA synthetase